MMLGRKAQKGRQIYDRIYTSENTAGDVNCKSIVRIGTSYPHAKCVFGDAFNIRIITVQKREETNME